MPTPTDKPKRRLRISLLRLFFVVTLALAGVFVLLLYAIASRAIDRNDIDVVAIATHPGWHALISIAAMEAGKDVVCEKPMCRFISEGRSVADTEGYVIAGDGLASPYGNIAAASWRG